VSDVSLTQPKLTRDNHERPVTTHNSNAMDLDYSSSDDESTSATAPPPPPSKKPSGLSALLPKPKSRKQKDEAVDKDAPKKIVVNLPKFDDDEEVRDGRPAKKARIAGSGLSSMLPAPTRSGAAKAAGAPPPPEVKEEVRAEKGTSTTTATESVETVETQKPVSANNTMFVPQSVARKPIQPMSAFRKKGVAAAGGKTKAQPAKPKVSLFGAATANPLPRPRVAKPKVAGEYKPIMLEVAQPMRRPVEHTDDIAEEQGIAEQAGQSSYAVGVGVGASAANAQPQTQDLDALAREAGLDESEVCILLGAPCVCWPLTGIIDAPAVWQARARRNVIQGYYVQCG